MPDITMCEGTNCIVKEKCKRFYSTPSDYTQSYFVQIPFIIKNDIFSCEFYLDLNNSHSISLRITKDANTTDKI